MKKTDKHKALSIALLASMLPVAQWAGAVDVTVAGFVREEAAYQISDTENPYNRGNAKVSGQLPNTFLDSIDPGGAPHYFTKRDFDKERDWNLMATRAELNINLGFTSNWAGVVKLRGYYMADVDNSYGDPNNFEVKNHGNRATLLEISDSNYMLDIPAAYLDYSKGPLWVRIGQQQIAWGESLFFRVADVANGLDLRRHLFLDFGAEEYADERIGSPGIRISYNLNQNWEVELFAQMFQPSIYPNVGTPYAFINDPFTVRNDTGFDKVDDQINGGFRLRGQFGDLGVQLFAVSRHNPDPIFHFLPGGQTALGPDFAAQPFRSTMFPGSNRAPGEGTLGSRDWNVMATMSGIDPVDVLNGLAADYAWVADQLETGFGLTGPDYLKGIADTNVVIDAFFTQLGDLEADIEPIYAAENVFGGGLNYVFAGAPDSLLDQLIVRFEASYTPDKKFTNSLRNDFYEHDEYVTSLVAEKYQKVFDNLPATYFVFEWMHKSESDMVGRALKFTGGDANRRPTGGEANNGWDGVVFAFQQPFPNLTWRLDMAVLYDLDGGYLFQPGVRYKPNGDWTVELFANIMSSSDNASIFGPLEWNDELTLRVGYQF